MWTVSVRGSISNLLNLMHRVTAHKKTLGATGLAQRKRGKPTVGLKVNQIYGTPVLLSGVARLVLTKSKPSILDKHKKKTNTKQAQLGVPHSEM